MTSHGQFVVDGSRRVASVTDPVSLQVRQRLSLTARPGAGQSVVDPSGHLWTVDPAGLASYGPDGKLVWPGLGAPGARLVLVQGQPVLVDPSRSRIGQLSRDGGVVSSRLGVSATAVEVGPDLDLFELASTFLIEHGGLDYIVCDEAQFYAPEQVDQLARVTDELHTDEHEEVDA